MVIPFETRQTRQVRLDADRRQRYLQQFRRCYRQWTAGESTLAELCAGAGAALDGYATDTLEALRGAHVSGHKRTAWIAEQYNAGISSVGAAIRDEIEDASVRHAVAQTLQAGLFRAELLILARERNPPRKTSGGRS